MEKPKIEVNELTQQGKASMKTRVITALILAAICVPCVFLGGWFFFALSVVICGLCAYELVHVADLKTRFKYIIYAATIVLALLFTYWIFARNNIALYREHPEQYTGLTWWNSDYFLSLNFSDLMTSTVLILVAAGIYFGISFICEEFTVQKVFYLLAMTIIVSLCMQAILYLRNSPIYEFTKTFPSIEETPEYYKSLGFKFGHSTCLFVYVVLGTICTDIGAYFFGVFFGKHKLNPRISPKKTWEGFYGGCIFSFVFSAAFGIIMAAVKYPLLPSLAIDNFGWLWILLISAVMPLIANLGDFAFSAIKRGFGIKDFSNLLPGHGGILDRMDSLLFVSGFVAIMLIFINKGWAFFSGF